jgi:hypothetical protein
LYADASVLTAYPAECGLVLATGRDAMRYGNSFPEYTRYHAMYETSIVPVNPGLASTEKQTQVAAARQLLAWLLALRVGPANNIVVWRGLSVMAW